MISRELLNSQAFGLIKKFRQRYAEIWDIVAYGSSIRGKIGARDIDIAIILSQKTSLDKKLKLAQELRHSLSKSTKSEMDVKSIDLQDIMDPSFIARKAILAEGFSLARKKSLAEIFGFEQFYIFTYSLEGLSHSKKVMFRYALGGRREQRGLLDINRCEQLGKGVIKAPLQHAEEMKDFFERSHIKYKAHMALFY